MSRTAQYRRGSARGVLCLGLSVAAHAGMVVLVTQIYLAGMRDRARKATQSVIAVELADDSAMQQDPSAGPSQPVQQPPLEPLDEPYARTGDLHPAELAARAADTLAQGRKEGSVAGKGRPRPHPDPLAGDDLDDLRFRPFNHRSRDSLSRIRTARKAVTYDNERATPSPEPTPYLVTGRGSSRLRQRRTVRHGQRRGHHARAAREPGVASQDGDESPGEAAISRRYSRLVRGGHGARARLRPELPRSTPRTLTSRHAWALADNRNRQMASSRRNPDLLETGRPRGAGENTGRGQGARAGRKGDPTGEHRGKLLWLHTPDRRYVSYFRRIHGKIQPLWVFPRSLEVRLLQGDVRVRFTILADGKVTNIRVQKSSGFPKFDRVVMQAVARAAPFGPIPRGLGKKIHVLAPFEFHNPMVR